MSKLIAVQGCTISYTSSEGTVDVSGTVSSASGPVAIQGNKAYRDSIHVTVGMGSKLTLLTPPPGAAPSAFTGDLVSPGTITINGSSNKAKSGGSSFVLQGDEGSSTFIFAFTQMAGPTPIPVTVSVTAKVTGAGQNVVKAT